jgi:predicted  nucleic acid-binding Zn-ribbon protein
LELTNKLGCTYKDSLNIIINEIPVFDLGADQTHCLKSGETIELIAPLDDCTYLWNTGESTKSISISKSGKYLLELTNKLGCTYKDSLNIIINEIPVFDLGADQTHCLKSGETIELVAPLDDCIYLWNTGESTKSISVSKSGKYLLELTNKLGCTYKDSVNIIINEVPVFDLGADQTHCLKSSETVELIAPLDDCTYQWNTGESSKSISISKSSKYLLELTNKFGCTYKDSVNIIINEIPVFDLGADRLECVKSGEGLELKTSIKDVNYLWSTGDLTSSIYIRKSGLYKLKVSNSKLCSYEDSVNIELNYKPVFDLGKDIELCYGSKRILSSGLIGMNYSWNTGSTQAEIKVDKTGEYILDVNDGVCSYIDTIKVKVLPKNEVKIVNEKNNFCVGDSSLIGINKKDYCSYYWYYEDKIINRRNVEDFYVKASGEYKIVQKDHHNCVSIDSIELVIYPKPVVDLGPDINLCKGEELKLKAPLVYDTEWVPGGKPKDLSILSSGRYRLYATNENGCTGFDEIDIRIKTDPDVDLGHDTIIGAGTNVILDAGVGYVEYEWSDNSTEQTLTVSRDGEYSVNVMDVYGCRGDGNIKVSVNPYPEIHLGSDVRICKGSALVLDAGKWNRYQWNNGSKERAIKVAKEGVYSVKVWDDYGISTKDSIELSYFESDHNIFSKDTIILKGEDSYEINIEDIFIDYEWNDGSKNDRLVVRKSGIYSVKVTDINGCISQSSTFVDFRSADYLAPNVFCPNKSGNNEAFYLVFDGKVKDFELYIYSRWGELVYSLKMDEVDSNYLKNKGWSGIYNSIDSGIGIYLWLLFYDGKEQASGTVTLIR